MQASVRNGVLFLTVASNSLLSAADPVRVVSSNVVAGARQPQAAVAPDGVIFVTFGADDGIYCCASTESGKSFGNPVRIDELAGLSLGMRRGPRIVAGRNAIVVTAVSHDTGNVYAWHSTDAAEHWSEPTQVNDSEKDSREGLHAMAMSPDGNVYCTWLDLRSGSTEIYGSHSADGGRSWSRNQLVYRSPSGTVCECCHPSATYDATGNLHVMWRNSLDGFRDLFLTTSQNGGKTFSKAYRLGANQWKLDACPMDGGWLAATQAGQLTTVWRRDKQVFRTDSSRPGEQLLGAGIQPWVAGTPEGPYIVWLARRNGDLWLMTAGDSTPGKLADEANDPVIVAPVAGNGPVVAVWETGQKQSTTIVAAVVSH